MSLRGGPYARLAPGPLVLLTVCLCGGTSLGLRSFSGVGSAWISLVCAAAVASLGWLYKWTRRAESTAASAGNSPRRRGSTTAGLLLGATFAAGAACGGAAGVAAGRSCLTLVGNGHAVEVEGRLASPLTAVATNAAPVPNAAVATAAAASTRSSPASVRVFIVAAELRAQAGECAVRRLLVLVRRPQHALPAGTIVRLRGKWSAYGRPGDWPRRPERLGYVRGEISAVGAGAVADPATRPAGRAFGTPESRVSGFGPLQRMRAAGIQRVESRLPADVSPTAVAILLAERGRLDPATRRTFANAGLAHLLAISGLHVGILAAAALAVTGVVAVGAVRLVVAALLVLGYVVLIGAPPAAVRAALIFCGYAASRARGSPARITELLALAASLAVLIDPLTLLEPGFHLSFAGFSGLILGSRTIRRLEHATTDSPPVTRRRARRVGRSVARGISASVGAFALTAPISAWHFHRAAPVSVVSSLVGSPVVALALLALAGVLLLPGPLADAMAATATILIRWLQALVEAFSALPLGHVLVGRPGAVEWLVVVSGVIALLLFAAGRSVWRTAPYAGLAVCLGLASPAIQTWRGAGRTLLCTLDVGQGDAAVLRTRRGHWLAIDAGPRHGASDAGVRVVLPFLLSHGARSLELFVLTHPDLDHLGGAASLLERLQVQRVLDAALPVPAARYDEYLSDVVAEGARWLVGRQGARLAIDEVEMLVLGPDLLPSDRLAAARVRGGLVSANEASLSLQIRVDGGFGYVNAGDAPAAEERRMLASWPPDALRADVLKVSHHGSKTSSDVGWLKALAPELAIISAGAANRYGHPHPVALARLDSAGIGAVWRTDLDGTVCVSVDAEGRWRLEETYG
ncbi:MAG: DNA internalization-related competence protein ComEC/Rec2 [Gemmatimonadales bacterium]